MVLPEHPKASRARDHRMTNTAMAAISAAALITEKPSQSPTAISGIVLEWRA
jgi:hypothetical protein